MLIRQAPKIRSSEVTPQSAYLNRRRFLASVLLGSTVARGAASPFGTIAKSPLSTNETPTLYADVTSYNNYYEFGTSKEQPARYKDSENLPVDSIVRGRGGQAAQA